MKTFRNFLMTMESSSYPSLPKQFKEWNHPSSKEIEVDGVTYSILSSKKDVENYISNQLCDNGFPLAVYSVNRQSDLEFYKNNPEEWTKAWNNFQGYKSQFDGASFVYLDNGSKFYELENLNVKELLKVWNNISKITFFTEDSEYPVVYGGYLYPEFDSEDVDSDYLFHVEPELPNDIYEEDYKWVKVGKTMIVVYDKVRNIDFGFKKQ